jgi:uncharacterized protein
LVNNAGYGEFWKVQNQNLEQIEAVTRTNYFHYTKVFLQSMLSRHSGHIVNVASLAASFGVAGMAGYWASKYGILGFSEWLYHGTGVRITVVNPIGVKTNFFNNRSFENHKPNYIGFMLEATTVSKAILAAANSTRLKIMVPFYTRVGVWFKYIFPSVVNPVVGKLFRRELDRTPGNKTN